MRLPLILLAALLAGCSPPGTGPVASSGGVTGIVVVTAGGTALVDGEDDVPPTLDLGLSGSGLGGSASAMLDGRDLPLSAGDTLRASVAPMAYGSGHTLLLRIAGRPDQAIAFTVVDRAGVSAAAWADAEGPVADVVFERAPSRAMVESAVPGSDAKWRDDTHLRVRWPHGAPATLRLPAGIATSRGSVTEGPLVLPLGGLSTTGLRRATVPDATVPAHLHLTAFATGTSASHASSSAHAAALSALDPTGWRIGADGSLSGAPDAAEVAAAHAAGTPLMPLAANDAGDGAGTAHLLGDGAAVTRLAGALVGAARSVGAAGVNLDMEGVPGDARDGLTALVTALARALHAAGMTLSVDVVPHRPGSVNSASAAYDDSAIAAQADTVILMTYDQSVSNPGPIAGADWQATELAGTLPDLDPAKTLMGIPLYARRWSAGNVVADSYAASVAEALRDTDVRYDYDFPAATPLLRGSDASGTLEQTWFDDADSLARKLAAVPRLHLGGAAAWRLGFEDPGLWDAL
jgi:spore germination protein YaaH